PLMHDMPRPRPPHLHREITRHGQPVWYVRVGGGRRIRLRAQFGTDDFNIEYQAAVSGQLKPKNGASSTSTLALLIDRYRETAAWASLSTVTRRQRENIFKQIVASAGDKSYARITDSEITAGRDRRSSTPAQARHFLDTIRGLFRWAYKAKLV